jgi:hypothetical protein
MALTFSAGSGSWFIVTGIRKLVLKVFQIVLFLFLQLKLSLGLIFLTDFLFEDN